MADIPKLMLKPLRSDYNFSLGRGVVSTQTIAGLPRQRRDGGKPHRANVTYKCTRSQWQYFLAFMRAYEALPFLAYLLLDDVNHKWYECKISNEDLQVSTLGDQIFTVQLNLVAKPIHYPVDTDITIIQIYEMTDGQIDLYFRQLEKLVNEDLPKIKVK